MSMSGSAALAEDVVQEVFLTLIREAPRYDASRGSVTAFLYGIARNHVLRALEREDLVRYARERLLRKFARHGSLEAAARAVRELLHPDQRVEFDAALVGLLHQEVAPPGAGRLAGRALGHRRAGL